MIVDIGLPGGNGIELPEKIRAEFPKLRVLTLPMHEEPLYCRALRTDAQGYVVKREAIGKIVDALREILNRQRYVSGGDLEADDCKIGARRGAVRR